MSKTSRKTSNKCPSGKILRKGYNRKSYRKASGQKVAKAYVPATCVPDKGKPGKGPKTLPPVKEKGLLRKYGYSSKLNQQSRAKALVQASTREGPLVVLRHLNLIRNYQSDERVKRKMTHDVQFLSRMYSKDKSKSKRKSS